MTPTDIKNKFPEFTDITDSSIQLLLDEASIFITSKYGKYEDICLSYYVAHNLISQQNANNGDSSPSQALASEAVGSVSTSYANPTINSSDESYYMSTSYGQKYLEFRKKALRQFGAAIV